MAHQSSQGRIPELDGIRGLAIIGVLCIHYLALPGEGLFYILDSKWFRLTWSSVDLLFVLSGFLICGILLHVRNSPTYFKTFYVRRVFRIIPVYYASIFAYLLLVGLGGSFLRAHANSGTAEGMDLGILAQFVFLQNSGDYLTSTVAHWWFVPTWSLAIEEQFYLICPFLVRFFSKRILTVILALVTVGAPLFRVFVHYHLDPTGWDGYHWTPCRADSLAIGMLAAILWDTAESRQWLSVHRNGAFALLGALFIGVCALWKWWPDPLSLATQTFGFTCVSLFFGMTLLLARGKPPSLVSSFLRMGWLHDFGTISYCLYIIHVPIYLFSQRILLHSAPERLNWKTGAVTLLSVAISYSIAKLSWRFFEEPLIRRGHAYKY